MRNRASLHAHPPARRTLKVPVVWNSASFSHTSVSSPKVSFMSPVCQRHTRVRVVRLDMRFLLRKFECVASLNGAGQVARQDPGTGQAATPQPLIIRIMEIELIERRRLASRSPNAIIAAPEAVQESVSKRWAVACAFDDDAENIVRWQAGASHASRIGNRPFWL
jgi:hypothetical protein